MKFLILVFGLYSVWGYGQMVSVCDRTQQVRDAIIGKLSWKFSFEDQALREGDCYLAGELLKNIETLDLSEKEITLLEPGDFEGITRLVILNLSGNFLETVRADIFRGSKVLELDLSNNQLTNIDPDMSEVFNKVNVIDLSGNKLTHLPPGIFSGTPHYGKIILRNNAFPAAEKIRIIKELSASHPGKFLM